MPPNQSLDLITFTAQQIKEAVASERERCAKIAEDIGNIKHSDFCQPTAHSIAAAIRNKE